MKRRKRLLWQLYPTYLLITIISLGAATWFASRTLKQFYLEESASDLEARARLLETQIQEHLSPLNENAIKEMCEKIGSRATTRITVMLPSGKVIGDSSEDPAKMDNHANRPEMSQALAGQVGISSRYSRTVRKDMMYVGLPLKKDSRIIGEARGKGLMLGVEFVKDKATKEPSPELASQVRTLCHRRGLLIEIGGHYNNVGRFLPPLVLTEELALKGVEVFEDAVREAEKSR